MKLNRSPKLVPYPNYEMNQLSKDQNRNVLRIISTFRMSVDICDRLWVMDMGTVNGTIYEQPKIIVFNLKTDRVVRNFTITENLRRTDNISSWFVGVLADVEPTACDRAFAYLPDIRGGLVVYNYQDNTARRLDHPYFYYDPLFTSFLIGGVSVQYRDGVFGLSLSERHSNGYRTLYFQAMSSNKMFSVNTRVIQTNRSTEDTFNEYRILGQRETSMQSSVMSRDRVTGAVFFPLLNKDAIGCWNPWRSEQHSTETMTIVAQNSKTLEYPSDLKVDFASNLWVISDKLPKFVFQELDSRKVNYRVLMAPVTNMIKGTVCESPK